MSDEYVFITAPEAGDPTEIERVLQQIIDNQAYLKARVDSTAVSGIVNGSFENDGDEDGTPDGWDCAIINGGAFAIDEAVSSHGGKSLKFTVTAGGGGYAQNTSMIPCNPSTEYVFRFDTYSTVATMDNKAEVLWYDIDGEYISTDELWAEDTDNPSDWETYTPDETSPATAKFYRVKFTGGIDGSAAGSAYFDNVTVLVRAFHGIQEIYTTAGDYNWTCPSNVTKLWVLMVGAGGGGGGGGTSSAGKGGGAGAYQEGFVSVVPNHVYVVRVPSGGAGGAAGTAGSTGANAAMSDSGTPLIEADAGDGGGTHSGSPGGGGTGVIYDWLIGVDGDAGSGGVGGSSNCEPFPSTGGAVGATGAVGAAGTGYGAGGGGGGNSIGGGAAGGAGAAGIVVLRY